jgi:hypothetical protein
MQKKSPRRTSTIAGIAGALAWGAHEFNDNGIDLIDPKSRETGPRWPPTRVIQALIPLAPTCQEGCPQIVFNFMGRSVEEYGNFGRKSADGPRSLSSFTI